MCVHLIVCMTGLCRNQLAADRTFRIHREPDAGAVVTKSAYSSAIVAVNCGIFLFSVIGTFGDIIALISPFVDHIKASAGMRTADRTALRLK